MGPRSSSMSAQWCLGQVHHCLGIRVEPNLLSSFNEASVKWSLKVSLLDSISAVPQEISCYTLTLFGPVFAAAKAFSSHLSFLISIVSAFKATAISIFMPVLYLWLSCYTWPGWVLLEWGAPFAREWQTQNRILNLCNATGLWETSALQVTLQTNEIMCGNVCNVIPLCVGVISVHTESVKQTCGTRLVKAD